MKQSTEPEATAALSPRRASKPGAATAFLFVLVTTTVRTIKVAAAMTPNPARPDDVGAIS